MILLGLLALINIVTGSAAAIEAASTTNINPIDDEASKLALIKERRNQHQKALEEALLKV
jgi:hypothetical protein